MRSQTFVDSFILNRFEDLKIVGTATSGFDHLDLKALKDKNVTAFFTPEAHIHSTADLVLLHILIALRKNFPYIQNHSEFVWKHQIHLGHETGSHHLGLIGLGRIGKEVAKRCAFLGHKISYHDPYLNYSEHETQKSQGYQSLSLLEVFTQCDIISLHTPLTHKTKHLIDHRTLEHFGQGKILINCARGGLICTADLIQALSSGILAHVGLDTFENEPLGQNSVLKNHPQIFWTPHIGAYTQEAFKASCQQASENLIHYFNLQKPPPHTLPPDVLWAKEIY